MPQMFFSHNPMHFFHLFYLELSIIKIVKITYQLSTQLYESNKIHHVYVLFCILEEFDGQSTIMSSAQKAFGAPFLKRRKYLPPSTKPIHLLCHDFDQLSSLLS